MRATRSLTKGRDSIDVRSIMLLEVRNRTSSGGERCSHNAGRFRQGNGIDLDGPDLSSRIAHHVAAMNPLFIENMRTSITGRPLHLRGSGH